MKICGIYKITSPSNKIYIGQSIDIITRIKHYKLLYCKAQRHLYASIKKYGWEKHKIEIIEECLESELNKKEIYYIALFQTFNSKQGMNLQSGGGASGSYSEETKRKISERLKQEYRMGRKMSLEHKQILIKYHKGRTHTEETREKISRSNKGRIVTDETKEKLRTKLKGNTRSRKIVFNKNSGVYYDSAEEAARMLNINYSTLKAGLIGKIKKRPHLIYA